MHSERASGAFVIRVAGGEAGTRECWGVRGPIWGTACPEAGASPLESLSFGTNSAADVTLKERRPLVLCVRETPLNRVHIRNMSLAADAGATIFPLIPTLYNRPATFEAMAQEFANRVLSHIGLPQKDAYQWKG